MAKLSRLPNRGVLLLIAAAAGFIGGGALAEEGRFDPAAALKASPPDIQGARAAARGLPIRRVSLAEVKNGVLSDNLALRSAGASVRVAEAQVVQADAFFDPTIFAGLSYTNAFTKARREDVGRERNKDVFALTEEEQARLEEANAQRETLGLEALEADDVSCTQVIFDGEDVSPSQGAFDINGDGDANDPGEQIVDCNQAPIFSVEQEYASFESNSTHTAVGSLGVGLNFAFGGSASLNVASTWRKKPFYSTSGNPSLTTASGESGLTYDPYGWNDRPWWTTRASVSAQIPLPYTKNFGSDGSPQFFSLQSTQVAARRSGIAEQVARNASLARALQAYWDLVRNTDDLATIAELRAALTKRLDGQRRQLEAGLITDYDLNQIEVQLAGLDAEEELTWNFVLVNSNRLLTELGIKDRQLVLPAVDRKQLERSHAIDPAQSFQRALDNNPVIKLQHETHELSRLSLKFRESQDRPDLSLSASVSVGQTDSAYGYDGPWASWRNMVRPDSIDAFIGIRYRLPFGMKQTEAALSRARLEERQAFDQVRLTGQQVVSAVDRAISDLKSAEAVIKRSQEDVNLATLGYDGAVVQRDEGLISEFEVLNRYQDLLAARRTRTAAQVNYQKAYIQLLSAQGTLAQDYGLGA